MLSTSIFTLSLPTSFLYFRGASSSRSSSLKIGAEISIPRKKIFSVFPLSRSAEVRSLISSQQTGFSKRVSSRFTMLLQMGFLVISQIIAAMFGIQLLETPQICSINEFVHVIFLLYNDISMGVKFIKSIIIAEWKFLIQIYSSQL